MKCKDLLVDHYNKKYKYEPIEQDRFNKSIVKGYPKDRFEAAMFWGKGGGRALEIGAGSGSVASYLSQYYDQYVATELSSERVRYLKEVFKAKTNIQIIQNDIEERNLNFPLGYFDVIIMVAVLEHLVEPVSALKYCHSLLRPQGRLLIDTPNIAKWTRRLKLFFGFFPSTGSSGEGLIDYEGKPTNLHDDGHLHYFTFRSLRKLLVETVGFTKVRYCGHGRTFLSRALPALFSECFVIGIK